MVQNVSKPTYFESGHVFNSKLVSEPWKQFCFCCKIGPMIKISQNTILDTVLKFYIRVHIHVPRIPALVNRRYIQVCTQYF